METASRYEALQAQQLLLEVAVQPLAKIAKSNWAAKMNPGAESPKENVHFASQLKLFLTISFAIFVGLHETIFSVSEVDPVS